MEEDAYLVKTDFQLNYRRFFRRSKTFFNNSELAKILINDAFNKKVIACQKGTYSKVPNKNTRLEVYKYLIKKA